ncbi:hypothetical protein ACWZQY_027140 [Priestia megaterium]
MMLVVLVAYIFHELDKTSEDVPTTEVERNGDQWKHNEFYLPGPKKSKQR